MTFRSFRPTPVLALALIAWLYPAPAASATLPAAPAADLDPALINGSALPAATSDFQRAAFGSGLIFAADHPRYGTEPWISDGTPEGTHLLADLCPGPCSSSPASFYAWGDQLYFAATDGVFGREPWITDGTAAGTRMVRDICPGDCSSMALAGAFQPFVGLDQQVYFRAADELRGPELWVTDGTRTGTQLAVELAPGAAGSGIGPMFAGDSHFFFYATGPTSPLWLWASDGTPAGTVPLVDACRNGVCVAYPDTVVIGDHALLPLNKVGQGWELWASDGTAGGTAMVRDLCQLSCSALSAEALLASAGGKVYFAVHRTPTATDLNLWLSDGTAAGTRAVPPAPAVATDEGAALGDKLLFVGRDTAHGAELWATDGSPEGTLLLADTLPGPGDGLPAELTVAGDQVFFRANGLLWVSDGTAFGTHPVAAVPGGRGLSAGPDRLWLIGETTAAGRELWTSDGTSAGTAQVRDIHQGAASGDPALLTALGDRVVFDPASPQVPGLWSSDGTQGGTFELAGGPAGTRELHPFQGGLLYSTGAPVPTAGDPAGLWLTDGGVTQLKVPAIYGASSFSMLGSQLLFSGRSAATFDGEELWGTDGLNATLVKDIGNFTFPFLPPESPSSSPRNLVVLGNRVLFSATGSTTEYCCDRELWASDGTEEGTVLVRDIWPGESFSDPKELTLLGNQVLFSANDGVHGRQLWASDGTPEGTQMVVQLPSSAGNTGPRLLRVFKGSLWFVMRSEAGDALWMSDGTAAGTVKVHGLTVSGLPSFVSEMVASGDRLYFAAASEAKGAELWTSDGSTRGTRMLRDLRPGLRGSYPQGLTAVDGWLLFAADDGVHGLEPWATNGRSVVLASDLVPGPEGSFPDHFTAAGPKIFLRADDGQTGRELWTLERRLNELPVRASRR